MSYKYRCVSFVGISFTLLFCLIPSMSIFYTLHTGVSFGLLCMCSSHLSLFFLQFYLICRFKFSSLLHFHSILLKEMKLMHSKTLQKNHHDLYVMHMQFLKPLKPHQRERRERERETQPIHRIQLLLKML